MNKRFAVLTVLAVMLTAALGFTASAQDTEAAVGTGTLTAQGDGSVRLRGSGHIELTGNGVLKVRDCGGDAVIEVTGEGMHVIRTAGNCVVHKYVGFNGSAVVTGRHIKVLARGTDITLSATGHGGVLLMGNGTYAIGDQTGTWRERGVEIFLAE